MFTFEKQRHDPLFFIDDKPVYTTYEKGEHKRIPPFGNTDKFLDSEEFRERYNLTVAEGKVLKAAIERDEAPDQYKHRFYKVRRDLNEQLFTTIDLRGTTKEINWRFPEDPKKWPHTQILIGSSGVGKTHKLVTEITEALGRRRKRKFVFLSPQYESDATLKKLRNKKKWAKYFQGIDVGDEAFERWREQNGNSGTDEDFWLSVKKILDEQDVGTFVVLDDSPDSVCAPFIRPWLIKMLRTGRHKKIGVGSIQHNIRGGRWTSQSYSSVKWVNLFPRGGGKGLQVDFLIEQQGVSRKRARELVDIFGDTGRWMTIHSWSPPVIFGPKYAVFL